MTRERSVLFICPTFPPHVGGALARNLQFIHHLPEFGWRPIVLTIRAGGGPWQDASPLAVLADVPIVRAWSPRYPTMSAAVPTTQARSSRLARILTRTRTIARDAVVDGLLVPDREVPWVPFAILAARVLSRERAFEAVLSAGPPHSAHLVAAVVRGRRVWVADCTDPWAEHPFRARHLRTAIDERLERAFLGRADAVVTPSETLSTRFGERLAGLRPKVVTISNGYDEAEFTGVVPETAAGKYHVLHLGSFYGGRSPAPFLAALTGLLAKRPALRHLLQVSLYGYADPQSRAAIAEGVARLGDVLRYDPFVPRERAIRLMLGADLLLLVTDTSAAGRELIPLKTFEYLRAGRRILALVPDGTLRELLVRVGGARFAQPDDDQGIALALERCLDDAAGPTPRDRQLVEEFEARRLTERLATLLDRGQPGR